MPAVEFLTETVTMSERRMQTFNEWKASECGQLFSRRMDDGKALSKPKALEPAYQEQSVYDKLFGGPESAPNASCTFDKNREEDENSINFETFKIFMGGDGSGPPPPGSRKKKRQSAEDKEAEMMQLFTCFDKERTGLVTIKNLRTVSADFGTDMSLKDLRAMIARAKESKLHGGVLPGSRTQNQEKALPGQRQYSQVTIQAKAQRRAAKQQQAMKKNPALRPKAARRDKYELLDLTEDHTMDVSLIKQQYLDKEIKFEHSKANAKCDAADEHHFDKVTAAFKVLTDERARLLYDSSADPQNVHVPRIDDDFFSEYVQAFAAYSRFSTTSLPTLGDAATPREEVESFYSSWRQFKSWRDFSYLDGSMDTLLDREAMSREEKRGMTKERRKESERRKAEEAVAVSHLVEQAASIDPRLNTSEQVQALISEVKTAEAEEEAERVASQRPTGPQQQSRGLQKLRNRLRSCLAQLRLSTDHTIEVADILLDLLGEEELASDIFSRLEDTKLSEKQARRVIDKILSRPGNKRKKAMNKLNAMYDIKPLAPVEKAAKKTNRPKKAARSKVKQQSRGDLSFVAEASVNSPSEASVTGGGVLVEHENYGCSSSDGTSDCDDGTDELREKLSSLKSKFELAKVRDDFENCISLRDQIKSVEEQLSAASSSGGSSNQVSSMRAKLSKTLALLQQALLADQSQGGSSNCSQAAADAKQKSVLARIRTEQASILEELEHKSAIARAEVAAIPSAVIQLQALLQETDDTSSLSQTHFDVQGSCENLLASLRACQPFHSKPGFDGIVGGARSWCGQAK